MSNINFALIVLPNSYGLAKTSVAVFTKRSFVCAFDIYINQILKY